MHTRQISGYAARARRAAVLLAVILPAAVHAQDEKPLDLASIPRSDTVQIRPGRYQIRVTSLVPKYRYTIAVSQGVETLAPISLSQAMGVAAKCAQLKTANSALLAATKEGDVARLKQDVLAALNSPDAKDTACKDDADNSASLLARTERLVAGTYSLAAGDYIVVDVARFESEDGAATQRWTRRLTTGAPGEWHITYGYVFPFLARLSKGHFVREGQNYYARQIGDTGSKYVITQERRTRQFDAVPAVTFSYVPTDERGWGWNKLTAGLGADLTKPALFLGTGITYHSNLLVTGGASFREESVLLGRYAAGDTVRSNLSQDQLQGNAFRVRPYLSVSIRFDKNPFKKDAGSDTGSGSGSSSQKPADSTSTPKTPAAKKPAGGT